MYISGIPPIKEEPRRYFSVPSKFTLTNQGTLSATSNYGSGDTHDKTGRGHVENSNATQPIVTHHILETLNLTQKEDRFIDYPIPERLTNLGKVIIYKHGFALVERSPENKIGEPVYAVISMRDQRDPTEYHSQEQDKFDDLFQEIFPKQEYLGIISHDYNDNQISTTFAPLSEEFDLDSHDITNLLDEAVVLEDAALKRANESQERIDELLASYEKIINARTQYDVETFIGEMNLVKEQTKQVMFWYNQLAQIAKDLLIDQLYRNYKFDTNLLQQELQRFYPVMGKIGRKVLDTRLKKFTGTADKNDVPKLFLLEVGKHLDTLHYLRYLESVVRGLKLTPVTAQKHELSLDAVSTNLFKASRKLDLMIKKYIRDRKNDIVFLTNDMFPDRSKEPPVKQLLTLIDNAWYDFTLFCTFMFDKSVERYNTTFEDYQERCLACIKERRNIDLFTDNELNRRYSRTLLLESMRLNKAGVNEEAVIESILRKLQAYNLFDVERTFFQKNARDEIQGKLAFIYRIVENKLLLPIT